MKQHFKGIIWPRESVDGKIKNVKGQQKIYRYVIVGMVVTDQPIKEFEGKNEIVLDGPSLNLVEPLTKIKKRKAKYPLGDASSVLLDLQYF